MADGFLAWVRPRRLTWRRMTLTLLALAAVTGGALVLAPLFGVEPSGHGWHVALIDLRAAFTAGSLDHDALWQVRVPRVLAAAVVGAALGASGCVFQALLRNPLAEPYTLGVSSGAAL